MKGEILNIKVTGTRPRTFIPYERETRVPNFTTHFVFEDENDDGRLGGGVSVATPLLIPMGYISVPTMIHYAYIPDERDSNSQYLYPEEDPEYDEENPHGDDVEYGDV